MNEQLATELTTMAERDVNMRAELAASGALFEGYHPRMATVHAEHAARLAIIVDELGWPGRSLVGERAAVGLGPLASRVAEIRNEARAIGDTPPDDVARYRRDKRAWAVSVGWRVDEDE